MSICIPFIPPISPLLLSNMMFEAFGFSEGSVLRVAETYLSYLRATALADTLALSDYPTAIYASWLQKY